MDDLYSKSLAYVEQFNPPLPPWLRQIRNDGLRDQVPIVRDDMGHYLKSICGLIKPQWILEIGCGISYGTHWMLWGSPQSQILAIDANPLRIEECREYLKVSGFEKQVTLMAIWAEEFFAKNQQQFDLIFQDSTKRSYIDMLDGMVDALKVGGILIVDNIFYNNKVLGLTSEQQKKYSKPVELLNQFNRAIADHPRLECTFLPLSDGTLFAKKIQ